MFISALLTCSNLFAWLLIIHVGPCHIKGQDLGLVLGLESPGLGLETPGLGLGLGLESPGLGLGLGLATLALTTSLFTSVLASS
jgi:hypothetical protein